MGWSWEAAWKQTCSPPAGRKSLSSKLSPLQTGLSAWDWGQQPAEAAALLFLSLQSCLILSRDKSRFPASGAAIHAQTLQAAAPDCLEEALHLQSHHPAWCFLSPTPASLPTQQHPYCAPHL